MIPVTLTPVGAHVDPIARANVYRLLSLAFRYPSAEAYQSFQDGDYVAALRGNLAELDHLSDEDRAIVARLAEAQQALAGLAREEFESQYVRTFEVGSPKPPCPPYEGFQRKQSPRNAVMLNISAFYKHFGLAMSNAEGKRELPDHISAELEFLHFLAFKEGQVRETDAADLLKDYVLAQRDFLVRHPCRWVGQFADKVKAATECAWFSVLAELTAVYLNREASLVQGYLAAWGVPEEIPVAAADPASDWTTDDAGGGCSGCPDPAE